MSEPSKIDFFRSPSLALQMYWARDRLLNVTSKYRKLNCWTHFMLCLIVPIIFSSLYEWLVMFFCWGMLMEAFWKGAPGLTSSQTLKSWHPGSMFPHKITRNEGNFSWISSKIGHPRDSWTPLWLNPWKWVSVYVAGKIWSQVDSVFSLHVHCTMYVN